MIAAEADDALPPHLCLFTGGVPNQGKQPLAIASFALVLDSIDEVFDRFLGGFGLKFGHIGRFTLRKSIKEHGLAENVADLGTIGLGVIELVDIDPFHPFPRH